jgi:mycothiol synthase
VHYDVSERLDRAQRSSIGELLTEVEQARRRPALSDHLMLDLRRGGSEGFVAVTAASRPGAPPVAYAQASRANEAYAVEIATGTGARPDIATLGRELLDRLLDAIAASGGGSVNLWVHGDAALVEVADHLGFVETRRLHQMRTALPAARSAEVFTRSFVVGRDEDRWVHVNNRAFAGHGEQGGWTADSLRLRESESWFDPDGFRIHERDGRMAAFCWTKVHTPTDYEPERIGEIYVIAVDPDFHGLGLGSQLTLAGLDHLTARGITTASLYVDAANATAVTMYERLGFSIHATSTAHQIEVPAAPRDAAPRATAPQTATATGSETDR